MKIVAIVESDDYSGAAILDPSHITVVQVDNTFFAASRCMFSGMGVTCEIDENIAYQLIGRGVELISADSLTGR
jgi:hypothetical protein